MRVKLSIQMYMWGILCYVSSRRGRVRDTKKQARGLDHALKRWQRYCFLQLSPLCKGILVGVCEKRCWRALFELLFDWRRLLCFVCNRSNRWKWSSRWWLPTVQVDLDDVVFYLFVYSTVSWAHRSSNDSPNICKHRCVLPEPYASAAQVLQQAQPAWEGGLGIQNLPPTHTYMSCTHRDNTHVRARTHAHVWKQSECWCNQ